MTSNLPQEDRQDGANPDSEEEEDYMSDAFLQKLEKGDVRPGLKHVRQNRQNLIEVLLVSGDNGCRGHWLGLTLICYVPPYPANSA